MDASAYIDGGPCEGEEHCLLAAEVLIADGRHVCRQCAKDAALPADALGVGKCACGHVGLIMENGQCGFCNEPDPDLGTDVGAEEIAAGLWDALSDILEEPDTTLLPEHRQAGIEAIERARKAGIR